MAHGYPCSRCGRLLPELCVDRCLPHVPMCLDCWRGDYVPWPRDTCVIRQPGGGVL